MNYYSKKEKAFTLTEIMIAIVILAVGILPVLGLYTSNTKNMMNQKEEMIAAYVAKRIMETIRQFNANSSSNFDMLTMFNVSGKKIIDNTLPGEIFTNFEDLSIPAGFSDEPGLTSARYPELFDQMEKFTYSITVGDYVDTYKYHNYYGTGTVSTTLKDLEVKVTSPHRRVFVYRTLLTRSGI